MVAVDIVAGIVRFDPEYLVVPHVQSQRATAAAVNRTSTPDHFILAGLLGLFKGGCGRA